MQLTVLGERAHYAQCVLYYKKRQFLITNYEYAYIIYKLFYILLKRFR